MKKVYQFFQKINVWLASFGADRYLHLIVGAIISIIVCLLMKGLEGGSVLSCTGMAMMITVTIGVMKEVLDQSYESKSDLLDILFTTIGGLVGCAIWIF